MFEKYEIDKCLGRGAGGTVYSATRMLDHCPVAIKVVSKNNVSDWVKLPDGPVVPKEVALLEKLGCVEGVVKLLDYYERGGSFHIVMKKHERDLFDFITDYEALPESLSRRFFRQVVRTIDQCHRLGVTHGDIKDENIVLSDLNPKLVDFGFGEFLKPDLEMTTGTPGFSPPEMILRGRCDAVAGTVWSLGVLLYDMLTGRLPFEEEEDILRAEVKWEDGEMSSECKDLIRQCLQRKAEDRPTVEEVLEHEWMRG